MGLYNFRFLEHLKIDNLVVNTFHLPNRIEQLYQNQNFFTQDILFSNEENKILGSAGGLKQASQYFLKPTTEDTVLMLNSDEVLFDIDPLFLAKAHQKHLAENNLATLVVMKHPEAGKKFGAIWCNHDRVVHIGKDTPTHNNTAVPFHYIGLIFLKASVLNLIAPHVESNIFYDVLIDQLQTQQVSTYEVSTRWYETGNAIDFFSATQDALLSLDQASLNFINKYDDSILFDNSGGRSLVSKELFKKFNLTPNQFKNFNVVSKTTNPNLITSLGLFDNTICFENEILNESFFKA